MQRPPSIQRAVDLLESRLREPLPLGDLARFVGMSLWHFQRTFTAIVGEPAGSYLRRRRIAEAARALRTTQATILEIALEFQFESHEAFSRAFKSALGVTPSAWREGSPASADLCDPARISAQLIHDRYHTMHLQPEFVTLPARTYIGLQASFVTALATDTNNLRVIPELWQRFTQRAGEPRGDEPGIFYGLSDDPESHGLSPSRPDEILYLAAVRAAPGAKPPQGMTAWSTTGGTYAKFVHKGSVHSIAKTVGYIYAEWLPNAAYERVDGPDIERYDDRFDPNSEASVLEFYIPVRAKTA